MIVAPNSAQPELVFVLLDQRELELVRDLLRKPKGSPEAKRLASRLRAALKEARQQREPHFPYIFGWGNNSRRADLKGHACRIVQTGKMGSCIIEFENGERVVTSRRALRGR